MPSAASFPLRFLDSGRFGSVESVAVLSGGLSGARSYAVTTSTGAYVLKVGSESQPREAFEQQVSVQRRAADAGVAPALRHVDAASRAILADHAPGVPLGVALSDPSRARLVLLQVVRQLSTLHSLPTTNVPRVDPIARAKALAEELRERGAFPTWGESLESVLADVAEQFARDPRYVVSHNDVNPGNVLCDGERAWLVDWDSAGLGHPHYDLATLSLFFDLTVDDALGLLSAASEARPEPSDRGVFSACQRAAAIAYGLTFSSLVDEPLEANAPSADAVPSLADCWRDLRVGALDLESSRGRALLGQAFLARGLRAEAASA